MKFLTAKNLTTGLSVWISFVFLQSAFFKFTGAPETKHIFDTVGAWMTNTLSSFLGQIMTQYGGYIIGSFEVIASVLLLLPVLHRFIDKKGKYNNKFILSGALLAFGIMTGALFFHLFTPLGINVQADGGTLFSMAISVWIASLVLMWKNKPRL